MTTKKRAAKKIPIDYKNGKIYKLVNSKNDMLYIGSTTTTLTKRFYTHKAEANSTRLTSPIYEAMRDIGIDNFAIILLENFACGSKSELEAREYAVMITHKKEALYNSVINGVPSEASKQKMKDNNVFRGKLGPDCHLFRRGCIRKCVTARQKRWDFSWREGGITKLKSYTYGGKRTSEMAYLECIGMREQIYPFSNLDYLNELPFAE